MIPFILLLTWGNGFTMSLRTQELSRPVDKHKYLFTQTERPAANVLNSLYASFDSDNQEEEDDEADTLAQLFIVPEALEFSFPQVTYLPLTYHNYTSDSFDPTREKLFLLNCIWLI